MIFSFHSIATLSFANSLAEGRKYGLSHFLAYQYIEQMDERVEQLYSGMWDPLLPLNWAQLTPST